MMRLTLLIPITSATLLATMNTVPAQWAGDTGCKQTANYMLQACVHDGHDDRMTTKANCLNITDSAERSDCFDKANMVRKEEKEICLEQHEARRDACEVLEENRYDPDPLLDPSIVFIDPDQIPDIVPANPYVSLVAGHTYVLRAGEDGEEIVLVHATEDSREIQGVLCRVVVDIVLVEEEDEEEGEIDYIPVEVTDDWFAQDIDSNVYYCGEIARNYEDDVLVDIDGSFEAGRDFAKAGVLIKAFPTLNEAHRQEFALGEAEDIVQYINLAAIPAEENPAFPCAPDGCLQTFDFSPLDPESSEFKYYLPGTGFVLAEAMEDGELTGEREELLCVGDSLEILADPSCEIEDLEELLEELCELSPDAFCDDDDEE